MMTKTISTKTTSNNQFPPKMLTKEEAAKLLRISQRTLDTARAKHGLPYISLPGCRKILFDREQLEEWLRLNSVNSLAEENVTTESAEGRATSKEEDATSEE